jgi:hypothetical protein
MSTGSSGRQKESALLQAAQDKSAAAETVDPNEAAVAARVKAWEDWRSEVGGPPDVRNMPDQIGISLYRDARSSSDAGRVGRGLNTLGEGANPNFTASLEHEDQLERDLNASGQLEGFVSDRLGDLDAKELGLAARSDARRSDAAARAQRAYEAYINRPRRNSFLKDLALGFVNNAHSAPPGA